MGGMIAFVVERLCGNVYFILIPANMDNYSIILVVCVKHIHEHTFNFVCLYVWLELIPSYSYSQSYLMSS